MIFKTKFLTILLSSLFLINSYQSHNALKLYNQKLKIVRDRLNNKPWQSLGEVKDAITFLEEITEITSHSNGNYFGRYAPTEEDYTNWKNWLKKNKSRLYWDEKDQKVKVKDQSKAVKN